MTVVIYIIISKGEGSVLKNKVGIKCLKAIALVIVLALVACSFFGCGKEEVKPENRDFKVTAYIRGDYIKSEDDLCSEDFDIITDVIVFECASFDSNGEVIYEKEKLESVLGIIRNVIGDRDINITLNLLGPSAQGEFESWEKQMEAQSDEHNKAFKSGVLEDNIVSVLDEFDFQGVHFDYEYPLSDKAWRCYNKFLVSLDEKLGDYTLGVSGVEWNMNYSSESAKAIDSLELMMYDYVDENGKHATFEDITKRLEATDFGKVALWKVNVGLPFYSRPTDLDAFWYGYNSCFENIDKDGWYHCPEIDKDFWFNTPKVIAQKTEYAIENGYGGVMVWHYNCDLPSTEEGSLFRAIGDTVVKK